MKYLKHLSKLFLISLFSLILVNCENIKPEDEIMLVSEPDIVSSQLKAAEASSSIEISYLLDLITTIKTFYDDGLLNKGNANALISKIENAIESIEKENKGKAIGEISSSVKKSTSSSDNGNDNSARGQLQAFINQVNALINSGNLPVEEGQQLINEAEIIINQLNGLTYVPDDNFEQALIELGVDSPPLDDYVPTTNIETITSLDLQEKNITELTGIRSFASLRFLNCNFNQLTSLDVSSNTALTLFNCYGNQLSSLDVSNNTALTELNCGSNLLTSLDVSNNTSLVYLNCFENQLSILDVSNNTALTLLMCAKVQLSVLDVSNNIALTTLVCADNQLSVLDVSNNIGLIILVCPFNQLSVLDVSNNTSLTSLAFANNQLSSLDISNNHALTSLHSLANYSLFCIQVENIADLPDTYFIDPHTSFSEDCGY